MTKCSSTTSSFQSELNNHHHQMNTQNGGGSGGGSGSTDYELITQENVQTSEEIAVVAAAAVEAEEEEKKPSKPRNAFHVFMEEFRKQFKVEHPDNKRAFVEVKAAGNKWKSMSEAEKAPYEAIAEKKKVNHQTSPSEQTFNDYELIRQERLKENIQKMQSLGVYKQTIKLKKPFVRPAPSLTPSGPLRRSSRVPGGEKSNGGDSNESTDDETEEYKDWSKPSKPGSAFFVFLDEFRKQFKKEHPDNKNVAVVTKAAGNKWKSMSEAEKAPYVATAEMRKADYYKEKQAYKRKLDEVNSETGNEKAAEVVD